MISMTEQQMRPIVVGVDTHKAFHVAAIKDELGRDIAEARFDANGSGYEELWRWATRFGQVEAFGIEGVGSYGSGLARHLRGLGTVVVEVGRPSREHRAQQGKSDLADARAAAGAVLAGRALGEPKAADGSVEMIRTLRLTRETAVRARSVAVVTLQSVLVTAPEELR
jgi:transposase